MSVLYDTLHAADPALLNVLATVWGVRPALAQPTLPDALRAAMLDVGNVERVWSALPDDQRQALQTLVGSQKKMPLSLMERLFGEVRRLSAAEVARAQPLLTPKGPAEGLYYRGLIAIGNQDGPKGPEQVVFVPTDLAKLLPTHQTAYANLADEVAGDSALRPGQPDPLEPIDDDAIALPRPADTSLVDDLTTLLAFVRQRPRSVENPQTSPTLTPVDADALAPFLLRPGGVRLAFIVGLALDAQLLEVDSGLLHVRGSEARRWLQLARGDQVRALAQAWREGNRLSELWLVPGLTIEAGGTLDTYNPTLARTTILKALRALAPERDWFEADALIEAVHATDRDFQRPNGDYHSWYIRDRHGEYLRGPESWHAVEGALLELLLAGPLHWLVLLDAGQIDDDASTADNALPTPDVVRLSVYGRALLELNPWPSVQDVPEPLAFQPDGTLVATRKLGRTDRFQLARFATWGALDGQRYPYTIDPEALRRAAQQQISPEQIGTFLRQATDGAPLPATLDRLLHAPPAPTGDLGEVTLGQVWLLQTHSSDILDAIHNEPSLRRFLGRRVGPDAALVRADQWQTLADALAAAGYRVGDANP